MGFRGAVAATCVATVLAGSAMFTAAGSAPASATALTDLRVGSYNISNLAFDSRAAGEHKVWKERRPVIRKQILYRHLDVVGLQEANPSSVYKSSVSYGANQFDDLKAAINGKGYQYAMTNEYAYNCVKATSSKNCVYSTRAPTSTTRRPPASRTATWPGRSSR
jgi:endonuclease/exonuclease/phosphatase family metal-dependent hydrolase